jgi:hypothetical protein
MKITQLFAFPLALVLGLGLTACFDLEGDIFYTENDGPGAEEGVPGEEPPPGEDPWVHEGECDDPAIMAEVESLEQQMHEAIEMLEQGLQEALDILAEAFNGELEGLDDVLGIAVDDAVAEFVATVETIDPNAADEFEALTEEEVEDWVSQQVQEIQDAYAVLVTAVEEAHSTYEGDLTTLIEGDETERQELFEEYEVLIEEARVTFEEQINALLEGCGDGEEPEEEV